MKAFSKGIGKDLKVALYESSRTAFQNACHRILETIYPHIVSSRELGSIDSFGIDLYTRSYDTLALQQGFQCKGFELPEFLDDQLHQCIKSISSFSLSPLVVDEFYLVINRHIKEKYLRERLSEALAELVSTGKAKSAILLETNTFLDFVFIKIDAAVLDLIIKRNDSFRQEYKERMDQNFYLTDVPFTDNRRHRIDPSQYIKKTVYSERADNSNLRCWTFIVSEFGFGKTSLLLNLPLLDEDRLYIYVPIAQFASDAFSNEATLSRGILSILLERELELNGDHLTNLADKLLALTFTLLLRSNKKIVLLYDGLDEHHRAYTESGLIDIFNCASAFTCHSVFSVRKEFVDERQGNFLYAIGKKLRPTIFHLYLTEWKEIQISKFLEKESSSYGTTLSRSNLELFHEIVNSDSYEKHFGDIPKRPLFLKMLSDDIARHGISDTNLTQLYEKYLINKFHIDKDTSARDPKSGRPFREKGDIFSRVQVLFRIMTQISGQMITINKDGTAILEESIAEQDINSSIRHNSKNIEEIIEIMMMSVLIPFDKRRASGLRAKFAHRSFQEYFTARYLIEILINNARSSRRLFHAKYSEGVKRFFIELLDDIHAKEKSIDWGWFCNVIPSDSGYLVQELIGRVNCESTEAQETQTNREYDVFVSHASEDKDNFVRPFCAVLESLGYSVWYDEFSINVGDSIRESIDRGILNSKFGIVVLSHYFFSKSWAQSELNALFSQKTSYGKTILPILHNISISEVGSFSPLLSDIASINTEIGIEKVVEAIVTRMQKA